METIGASSHARRPVDELKPDEARARIQQEDVLINHRMSWLMSSQAFLLTAFVLLRNNPSIYAGSTAQVTPTDAYLRQIHLLIFVICLTGFVIAFCTSIGVFAAFNAVASWRAKVKPEERRFLTSDARLAYLGGLAAVLPGPMLASIWIVLFLPLRDAVFADTSLFSLAFPISALTLSGLLWLVYTVKTYFTEERG